MVSITICKMQDESIAVHHHLTSVIPALQNHQFVPWNCCINWHISIPCSSPLNYISIHLIHVNGGQNYVLLATDMAKAGGPRSRVKLFTLSVTHVDPRLLDPTNLLIWMGPKTFKRLGKVGYLKHYFWGNLHNYVLILPEILYISNTCVYIYIYIYIYV